jgi:hypothetical protein
VSLEPGALAAIADLELVSRRIVDGTISGLHRSPSTATAPSSASIATIAPATI